MKKRLGKEPIFGLAKHLFRVLVFPSCNEPGLEVVRALLKSNKVEVWGGSSGEVTFDPSRQLLKHHLKLPHLSESNFKSRFLSKLRRQRINYVFPTVDALVAEFSRWREKGITFITCNPATANLVYTKSRLYRKLQGVIPLPEVYQGRKVELPAFAKPDKGAGARGSLLLTTLEDWMVARAKKMLISEFLPGAEYTVDAVNDLEGRLLFANPRLRGKIGRSIALGTKTVPGLRWEKLMAKIARNLVIEGPWFAQFKLDREGKPKLLEINCRIGGSSTLTRLAGVNIPLVTLFIFAGYPVSLPRRQMPLLVNRALENYCEVPAYRAVIWDLMDTLVRKDGQVDPESITYLYELANRRISQFLVSREKNLPKLISKFQLPDFFRETVTSSDKVKVIQQILKRYRLAEAECVVVNDSVIENLALQKAFPRLRTLGPDALASLGRQKLA